MRQIISAARCLTIALALVAAFMTLSTPQQAAAHFSVMEVYNLCMDNRMAGNQDRFNEFVDAWGVHHYSCSHEGGDVLICEQAPGSPPSCIYIEIESPGAGNNGGGAGAPNSPEPHIGDPPPGSAHGPDGELMDQSGPIGPAPVANSHTGFETNKAGQG